MASSTQYELEAKRKYSFLHAILYVFSRTGEFEVIFNVNYIKISNLRTIKLIQFFDNIGLPVSSSNDEITNSYKEKEGMITVKFTNKSVVTDFWRYCVEIPPTLGPIEKFPLTEEQKSLILSEIRVSSRIQKATDLANGQMQSNLKKELNLVRLFGRGGKPFDTLFNNLRDEVRASFGMAKITPGSNVGISATESTSEPATQATMKTFQVAGTATNINYGLAQTTETLNVMKNVSQEVTSIHLVQGGKKNNYGPLLTQDRYSYNDVIKLRNKFVCVRVGDLYSEPPRPEIVGEDVQYYYNMRFIAPGSGIAQHANAPSGQFLDSLPSEMESLKGWFLRLKFNVNELYRYHITLIDIKTLIKNKHDAIFESTFIVTSELSEGILDIFPITKKIIGSVEKIYEKKATFGSAVEDDDDAGVKLSTNSKNREIFRSSFEALSNENDYGSRARIEMRINATFLSSIVEPAIHDLIIQGIKNVDELQPVVVPTLSIVAKETKAGENYVTSFNERRIKANRIKEDDYYNLMRTAGLDVLPDKQIKMKYRNFAIERMKGPPSSHGTGYLKSLIENGGGVEKQSIVYDFWEIEFTSPGDRTEINRYLSFHRFELLPGTEDMKIIRVIMPWKEWPLLTFLKENIHDKKYLDDFRTIKGSIRSYEINSNGHLVIQIARKELDNLKKIKGQNIIKLGFPDNFKFIEEKYSSLTFAIPLGINVREVVANHLDIQISVYGDRLKKFEEDFHSCFLSMENQEGQIYEIEIDLSNRELLREVLDRFDQVNLKYQTGNFLLVYAPISSEKPSEFINSTLKAEENELKEVRKREIKGHPDRIAISSIERAANYVYATTIGNNLREILGNRFVDPTRTFDNNANDIYRCFGIEATRTYLYKTIIDILDHSKSQLNPIHISVIADFMCIIGDPIPLTNTGITKLSRYIRGFLTPATVAFAGKVLKSAALTGAVDPLTSTSSQIYVAAPGTYGSNVVTIQNLNDDEMDDIRNSLLSTDSISLNDYLQDEDAFLSNVLTIEELAGFGPAPSLIAPGFEAQALQPSLVQARSSAASLSNRDIDRSLMSSLPGQNLPPRAINLPYVMSEAARQVANNTIVHLQPL